MALEQVCFRGLLPETLFMMYPQGDLVEFNQCLSQLKSLYADKVNGRRNEFTAYRMLFMLHARQRSGKPRG
jgi:hypothetical protein